MLLMSSDVDSSNTTCHNDRDDEDTHYDCGNSTGPLGRHAHRQDNTLTDLEELVHSNVDGLIWSAVEKVAFVNPPFS